MSEEEYDVVYNKGVIALIAIGILAAGIGIAYFLGVFSFDDIEKIEIPMNLPEIELPSETQTQPPPQPQVNPDIQEALINPDPNEKVLPSYEKYLEFGLSKDDILLIQTMNCSTFGSANDTLSTNPKFEAIFEQRRNECGL